jgi:hypothetical protein
MKFSRGIAARTAIHGRPRHLHPVSQGDMGFLPNRNRLAGRDSDPIHKGAIGRVQIFDREAAGCARQAAMVVGNSTIGHLEVTILSAPDNP